MISPRTPLAGSGGTGSRPDPDAPALSAVGRLALRLLSAPACVLALDEDGEPRLRLWSTAEPGVVPVAGVRELCRLALDSVPGTTPRSAHAHPGLSTASGPGSPVLAFASAALPGGLLGVLDTRPRDWSPAERHALADLAATAAAELERQRADAEREALAAVLFQSEGRYRRLLATCPSGIYAVDAEGVLTEVNAAATRILGRPAGEVVGHHFGEFIAPEDREFALQAFQDGLRDEGAHELELRIVRSSGERRTLHVTRAPIREAGRTAGSQGVVRDVTEERAKEKQLRRAERMASVAPLLSGVCHELNNPLTSIKSFAELLLLDERPEEDREALEIVRREAHRAAKIVSDLRVVARQSQESGTARSTVALPEIVEPVLRQRADALERAGISVRVELPAALPPVCVARAQLEQVVSHLVSNAEHAMRDQPAERELLVRAFEGGLGVQLLVADTGSGIHPEELDRIFDPFWTTRQPGEGTGLGLSVAQSILADHGGRITVESRPGRGARFLVELPVTPAPPTDLGDADEGEASRGLRILVVDDEAPIRFSLARYLERRGHRVVEAAEGADALRLLGADAAGTVDIILADLRMPGLDGGELLARLRLRGDGLDQRLVFMTGDAESPDADRVLRDAGVPVLWKPFELAEVAQIVEAQAGLLA